MPANMDVDEVLSLLTLEEKISLLAGANFSGTTAIPEKGVPAIKAVDGPNGVRSAATDESIRSACFPAACSLAATFDPLIAYRTGRALAVEARGKNAHCLLGPTVCIHRHPLGGRNFESFSEDPFLTGKLASQYIQGLQSLGVSATIKHFVANEQETQRTTVDESISERALREIYLKPFEIAVKEAKPWAIMTAYNHVNGTHCDNHEWLLQQVLRGDWGWKGLVMSDWGGTNSVASALTAGLDLEMPGPPRIRKLQAVLDALESKDVTDETIDSRVRAVLEFALKLKAYEDAADPATLGASTNTPELRAMLRDSAARGMVLLKNDEEILPLTPEVVRGKKIALIGFSKDALAHGGGSASVNAYYKVSPWDALHEALGDSVEFTYAAGAHRERLLPPLNKNGSCGQIIGLDGQQGFTRLLFDEGKEEPVKVSHGQTHSAYSPLGSQESLWRALEIVGEFTPLESGSHYIACSGLGPTRVFVDDEIIFEQTGNSSDPMGSLFLAAPEPEIQHRFEGGRTYRIRIRSDPPVKIGLEILEGRSGVRVGFALESVRDADLQGEAARVAAAADLAIIFTGHDPQWETEGRDQDSFNLPRGQNELIAAVADANPNVVVVNSTGVAVSMPWLGQVKGLVQAWFPGQECGNGIADVLTGVVNPEGRLPVSFPRRIEDAPAHGNFPGEYVDGQLKVAYKEGVFVGYRHFDRLDRSAVNFPFGYGLSYTTFALSNLAAIPSDERPEAFDITVDVTNTGHRAGRTLVQLYAGRTETSSEHPIKSLVGFQKVHAEPGETASARIQVDIRDFAHFDETSKQWVIDGGQYVFSAGTSAADLVGNVIVSLDRQSWAP
ncbi:thermostable beta-glucosidase B [Plectosphaerella cucumerina]|uniref:beta-glucosidase n=1 Tax=Plectosphaerella cucumerina TaxID=40658 RepID=A0A8K0WYS1_9PEZI|nr:thermostable beta-glucosidase B [Plectosphaerella cucumerina]